MKRPGGRDTMHGEDHLMTTYHEAEMIALRERVSHLEHLVESLARLAIEPYSEEDIRNFTDRRRLGEWLHERS